MYRPRLPILALLLSFACAETHSQPAAAPRDGQSYEQAIRLICDVDRQTGVDSADLFEAAERRHEFLQERVKNPDGIYFLTIFRTQDPLKQAESLRHEARELELQGCALADALENEG